MHSLSYLLISSAFLPHSVPLGTTRLHLGSIEWEAMIIHQWGVTRNNRDLECGFKSLENGCQTNWPQHLHPTEEQARSTKSQAWRQPGLKGWAGPYVFWMELPGPLWIQGWAENCNRFCNLYTTVCPQMFTGNNAHSPPKDMQNSLCNYGIGCCSKSRILGLTADPNGVPVDPKAYELKVQAICLPHTEYTVKKQAWDNHSEHGYPKRGRLDGIGHRQFWNRSARRLPRSHTLGPGSSPGQGTGSRPWGWEHWLLASPSGTSSFPITLLHHFWWGCRKMCKTLSLLPAVNLWGFRGRLQFWTTLI